MTCWRTRVNSAPSFDENLGGDALALTNQAEQNVLGADVVVAELQRPRRLNSSTFFARGVNGMCRTAPAGPGR